MLREMNKTIFKTFFEFLVEFLGNYIPAYFFLDDVPRRREKSHEYFLSFLAKVDRISKAS